MRFRLAVLTKDVARTTHSFVVCGVPLKIFIGIICSFSLFLLIEPSSFHNKQNKASMASSSTVAVGVDLGSAHARIATYDTNLQHPVVSANHDGHRETKVLWSVDDSEAMPVTTATALQDFYTSQILGLATSSAHTKDLSIVTSISNDTSSIPEGWLETLQSFGSVITEAAAVCLAYKVDASQYKRVLVLDGGASALKATILTATAADGLWTQAHFAKLDTVHGPALIEPLGQAVAQQFEQQHRFPRGEVWQSRKARRKLQMACEQCLGSFQRLQNVAIHVDSLYEGMDCNVTISKVKWEHLSSKLAKEVRDFCLKELAVVPDGVDTVLVAGNLHDWMMPIVKSTAGINDKLHPSTGSFDPSEAVALGCTLQAYWNLQQELADKELPPPHPTLQVPCCPVEIGLEGGTTLIAKGTPLPCDVTHEFRNATTAELVQTFPSKKSLVKLEDLVDTTTIQLHLSAQGRLRIEVNGESIVIG